ncbi:MAG: hypothetical protein CM1200mP31_4160 [Candidatus Neomarinimicrobiota bacterium]|nr:MAG: hypothetical protein CM1200mP31_4160 [Candidatus Neomarinimicrobiota bacterium]
MAHKKGQGSSRNGRDSVSKRLGIKTTEAKQFYLEVSLLNKEAQNIILDVM